MAQMIDTPTRITAAGQPPKEIEEFVGRANGGATALSIARMIGPAGWSEPGQTPEFDEYSLVLDGCLKAELADATFEAPAANRRQAGRLRHRGRSALRSVAAVEPFAQPVAAPAVRKRDHP